MLDQRFPIFFFVGAFFLFVFFIISHNGKFLQGFMIDWKISSLPLYSFSLLGSSPMNT